MFDVNIESIAGGEAAIFLCATSRRAP